MKAMFSLRSMQAMPLVRYMKAPIGQEIQWVIGMGLGLGLPLIEDLLVFPGIYQSLKGYRGPDQVSRQTFSPFSIVGDYLTLIVDMKAGQCLH